MGNINDKKGTTMVASEDDIRELRESIGEVHRKLDDRDNRQQERFERYLDANHKAHNCLQKQLGTMAISIASLAGDKEVTEIDKKVDRNRTKVNIMFGGLSTVVSAIFIWLLNKN